MITLGQKVEKEIMKNTFYNKLFHLKLLEKKMLKPNVLSNGMECREIGKYDKISIMSITTKQLNIGLKY